MRQAKTLVLRVSRVRVIDCYCGVTRMRYEAVATSAPPKLWPIGDRVGHESHRWVIGMARSPTRRMLIARPSRAGSPRARDQAWTGRRRRPKCGRSDPDMVGMSAYRWLAMSGAARCHSTNEGRRHAPSSPRAVLAWAPRAAAYPASDAWERTAHPHRSFGFRKAPSVAPSRAQTGRELASKCGGVGPDAAATCDGHTVLTARR
jgi:hypothetical protein